jgi:hypothetical protein
MRYFKGVEHLFTMFMDAEEIRIIHDAISMPSLSKKHPSMVLLLVESMYILHPMWMQIIRIQQPLFIVGVNVILKIQSFAICLSKTWHCNPSLSG